MHTPVLLKEVIELLDIQDGDIYLDATLGEGGHALEVWKRFGGAVRIAGIDADSSAVETVKQRFCVEDDHLHTFRVLNFRDIDKAPKMLGIARPNKIFFDLGWNRRQFETEEGKEGRGFSFQKDEPLDMNLSSDRKLTAAEIVNSWNEENIKTIIQAYGEERFAGRIARQIVESRKSGKIKTTFDLVKIINRATPLWYHFKKIHPATRTFQALRIAVNDELRALEEGLTKAFEILNANGRMAVISFHSLEDRIVKRYFKALTDKEKAVILTQKPIQARQAEVSENPRSRSAKLRAIKKLKD